MRKLYAVMLIVGTLAACGESAKPPANSLPVSEAPKPAITSSLDLTLAKVKRDGTTYCHMYWEVANRTNYNFSSLYLNTVLRDASGNIVSKDTMHVAHLVPNGNGAIENIVRECNAVTSIEVVGIDSLSQVDGNFVSRQMEYALNQIPIRSGSKVGGFSIKSSGEALVGVEVAQVSQNGRQVSNELEAALNPYTGTYKKFQDFKDNGGLNTVSDYYGLQVREVMAEFRRKDALKIAVMRVSGATAPKAIRQALNTACGTVESDWTREDPGYGANLQGNVKKGRIECGYIGTSSNGFEVSVINNSTDEDQQRQSSVTSTPASIVPPSGQCADLYNKFKSIQLGQSEFKAFAIGKDSSNAYCSAVKSNDMEAANKSALSKCEEKRVVQGGSARCQLLN